MSCFTTEDERPDEWTRAHRDKNPSGGPISATKGVWVRQMNNGDVELYHDGGFIASWGKLNEHVWVAMLDHIYDFAFREGVKKNQTDLRNALGLKP